MSDVEMADNKGMFGQRWRSEMAEPGTPGSPAMRSGLDSSNPLGQLSTPAAGTAAMVGGCSKATHSLSITRGR